MQSLAVTIVTVIHSRFQKHHFVYKTLQQAVYISKMHINIWYCPRVLIISYRAFIQFNIKYQNRFVYIIIYNI